MATKLLTKHEITTYPKGQGATRHRVMVSVLFDTRTIGNFETQDIVIYSGPDAELAEKLAKESSHEVHSGGVQVIRDGVVDP